MTLVSAVEKLQKRALTPAEITALNDLQQLYKVDDDDPLVVVLALMARSQNILESVPDLLQQKVVETIELHRTLLRDQAVLISKELIGTLAHNIEAANADSKAKWIRGVGFYVAGAITTILLRWLMH